MRRSSKAEIPTAKAVIPTAKAVILTTEPASLLEETANYRDPLEAALENRMDSSEAIPDMIPCSSSTDTTAGGSVLDSPRLALDHIGNLDIKTMGRTIGAMGVTLYKIRVTGAHCSHVVCRRYREFEELHREMCQRRVQAIAMPPKSFKSFWKHGFSPRFQAEREYRLGEIAAAAVAAAGDATLDDCPPVLRRFLGLDELILSARPTTPQNATPQNRRNKEDRRAPRRGELVNAYGTIKIEAYVPLVKESVTGCLHGKESFRNTESGGLEDDPFSLRAESLDVDARTRSSSDVRQAVLEMDALSETLRTNAIALRLAQLDCLQATLEENARSLAAIQTGIADTHDFQDMDSNEADQIGVEQKNIGCSEVDRLLDELIEADFRQEAFLTELAVLQEAHVGHVKPGFEGSNASKAFKEHTLTLEEAISKESAKMAWVQSTLSQLISASPVVSSAGVSLT